jgi:hypothetical protein
MKTKIAVLLMACTGAFFRMSGQSAPEESLPAASSVSTASPPTYEATTSGLAIKVWVMTREEHKRMIEANNSQPPAINDKEGPMATQEMSMNTMGNTTSGSGTHHIKVVVTDPENGQTRNDVGARVEILSPRKRSSWVDLNNMSNHYGADLTLKEKGQYTFTIKIGDNGVLKTSQFKYTVQ